MKNILLFVSIITYSLMTNAQNGWQKNDRQNVMDEGVSLLSKYNDIPSDKKQIIGKCYLDAITMTYNLEKYKNLIEYELRDLQKTQITKCAKEIGIDLSETKQEVKEEVVKEEWTKESKTNLYNEALSVLGKYELSQKQKETVSLCLTNEISQNFTKGQLDNMIEPEVKKIKNEYLKKCLDKNNVVIKQPNNNKLDKKSIIGCWQSSNDYTLCFFETGEVEKRMDKGLRKTSKGKWFLEAEKIILVMKDIKEEYKVSYYSGESLKLVEVNSEKEIHFTKMFNF